MKRLTLVLVVLLLTYPALSVVHPAPWTASSVLYELNTRQFTPEGTFRAVLPHVAELKRLGVGIVWFMPIHPIGKVNRKGTLGSPYSVQDYRAVNPEFGTLDDFKQVVNAIHAAGMHVIIDLVANHTAWDNPLVKDHPDWYVHDDSGHFVPPLGTDWSDVVQLDYAQPALREWMIDTMAYWVRDVGIDGFRCDVAGRVPTTFWEAARARLDPIKPVYMLAEAEKPELVRQAFDDDYASSLFNTFVAIARGKATAAAIDQAFRPDGTQMLFTTNHDQNAWLDSDIHLFGQAGSKAFATLIFTLPGKPLIYNGQEIGNAHKLAFFEHDPIQWHASPLRAFYTRLCHLYSSHPSLQHGDFTRLHSDHDDVVYAFTRHADGDATFTVIANLSPRPIAATLSGKRVRLTPWETTISSR
ncbi:MAG: alpha-amylase family glycosyl hydrolase [Candidatus Xenobia bacterium]